MNFYGVACIIAAITNFSIAFFLGVKSKKNQPAMILCEAMRRMTAFRPASR